MSMISTADKVYEFKHTFDHLIDCEYDIGLLNKFSNCRKVTRGFFYPVSITVGGSDGVCERVQQPNGRWPVTRIQIPESAQYWWGVEDILQKMDYPVSEPDWPIMSKRMLEVLLSVKDFPHQAIPIDVEDRGLVSGETGWERSGIHNQNFVILQLLEQLDIFDKENSIYDPEDWTIRGIEKMVFNDPEGGFPPIFRVSDFATRLYVSAKARTALEAADIKGVYFKELEGA